VLIANTSTCVPNDCSQCPFCVLPIMWCAFGAHLDDRALLMEYRALLIEYKALLMEYRALLIEYRSLSME